MRFDAGRTQTVLGDLTIDRARLRSTDPGNGWYLTLDRDSGRQALVQWVDVQDGNAANGQTIDAGTIGPVDRGNNINWRFPPRGSKVVVR